MLVALTHTVSPNITNSEVTFIDRQAVSYGLALQQHDAYCNALENCGAEVKKLSVNLDFPDSCFIEDSPTMVAELVLQILTSSSPRLRYRAGNLAKVFHLARWLLPEPVYEQIVRYHFKLDATSSKFRPSNA